MKYVALLFILSIGLISCGQENSSGAEETIRKKYLKVNYGDESRVKVLNLEFRQDLTVKDSMDILMSIMGPQIVESYEETWKSADLLKNSEHGQIFKDWINVMMDGLDGKIINWRKETDFQYLKRNRIANWLNQYNRLKQKGLDTVLGKIYYANVEYFVKAKYSANKEVDSGLHLLNKEESYYVDMIENFPPKEFDIKSYNLKRYE